MQIPKIWGQGQLFAFSALDGINSGSDDFAGYLSGDRIGVIFCTKLRRELALVTDRASNISFSAVTSDYISFEGDDGVFGKILFAAAHLVIGSFGEHITPLVFLEDDQSETSDLSIEGTTCTVCDSKNGEFTSFAIQDSRFAFSFAHSAKEAASLAILGLSLDMKEEEKKKTDFYLAKPSCPSEQYSELYAKCLSVMKTQLYSPEAEFTTIWSTPDRLPHRKLWLWDSVFHAIGFRNISPDLAEELILAIFAHQRNDGFIPHMAAVGLSSGITQPPIIGWGSLMVYERSGSTEFLQKVYDHNKRFLDWLIKNRRLDNSATGRMLFTWNTGSDVNCRCDESGMDNSPRFDCQSPLYAIDFSCFMASDLMSMSKIAKILGLNDEASAYKKQFEEIKSEINNLLWSEKDGFYFDFSVNDSSLNKVWSIASFLPLFAGVCSDAQCRELISHLTNPSEFATEFAIPSISLKDATYGSDMWRGPVWINFNYMISLGLINYGYSELAASIVDQTVEVMNEWYQATGCIFEFYDSANKKAPTRLNRKGRPYEPYDFNVRYQTIHDYGWSATLLFDMLTTTGQ